MDKAKHDPRMHMRRIIGMAEKHVVFVTVGTTSFDSLIRVISSQPLQTVLKKLGYRKLLLQIGRGQYEPEESKIDGFSVEFYRYKHSLAEDIQNASLIISHAGAGSVLEALESGTPLIVVINEELMGNHQTELAYQLYKEKHLEYCTCSKLADTLQVMEVEKLKPYTKGQSQKFGTFMDKIMGYS